jgi:hypothetical protein
MHGTVLQVTNITASLAGAYSCAHHVDGPFSEQVNVHVKKIGDKKANKGARR